MATQKCASNTILVVDDDGSVAAGMTSMLSELGYSACSAASAGEALTAFEADECIDLVLMDLELGDSIDGAELARRILEHRRVPIIFLTAHGDQEHVERVDGIPHYGYVMKGTGIFVLAELVSMALKLSRTDRQLRQVIGESRRIQEHYDSFLEDFQGIAFRIEPFAKPVFVRGAVEELTGYTESDFLSQRALWSDLVPWEDVELMRANQELLLKIPGYRVEHEHRLVAKNGETRWVREMVRSVAGEDGQVRWLQGTAYDITRRKDAERRLEESEESFRSLAMNSGDALAVFDGDLNPAYLSPATERLFGYSMDDALEGLKPQDVIHEEDLPRVVEAMEHRRTERPRHTTLRLRIRTKSGELRWIENSTTNFYGPSGEIEKMVMNIRDVTERKQLEVELKRTIEEKDRLMREVDHRVKNHLAMLSSLLELETRTADTAVNLSDISSQIRAIGLIHEKLYQSEHVGHIDVREYLSELVHAIFDSGSPSPITAEVDVPSIRMDTKTTTALGMIVNELATNTVKYGTPSAGDGRFFVRLEKHKNGKAYTLTAGNNGPPLDGSVDLEATPSVGLRLIQALVKQLRGELHIQRSPSPRFRIRFSP